MWVWGICWPLLTGGYERQEGWSRVRMCEFANRVKGVLYDQVRE